MRKNRVRGAVGLRLPQTFEIGEPFGSPLRRVGGGLGIQARRQRQQRMQSSFILFAVFLGGARFAVELVIVMFGQFDGVVEVDLVALAFEASGFHDLKILGGALEGEVHFDGAGEGLGVVEVTS